MQETKYRKRPVVVEAFQMTEARRNDNAEWPHWLNEAWSKAPHQAGALWCTPEELLVGTLEGAHVVSYGDWIVRGIKGELYPVKPDIFAATYEPASTPSTSSGGAPDCKCSRAAACVYHSNVHGLAWPPFVVAAFEADDAREKELLRVIANAGVEANGYGGWNYTTNMKLVRVQSERDDEAIRAGRLNREVMRLRSLLQEAYDLPQDGLAANPFWQREDVRAALAGKAAPPVDGEKVEGPWPPKAGDVYRWYGDDWTLTRFERDTWRATCGRADHGVFTLTMLRQATFVRRPTASDKTPGGEG